MTRSSRWVFLCLAIVLVSFPLVLPKPGLPVSLKADEAAYTMMALSLAHDGDTRLDPIDVERVFAEFPFRPVSNLIVMSRDGWKTLHYGKPVVYPLFAAPFARLGGANGMVSFNMLLFIAMAWLGARHLHRQGADGESWRATLFALAFFFLSSAFAYAFWLQPEVFNMAAITGCLYFGLPRGPERAAPSDARLLFSGGLLALAVYNKPIYALLGVAVLVAWRRGESRRRLVPWLAGAAGTTVVLAAIGVVLTGTPTSYLGVTRQGVTLCEPGVMPSIAAAAAAGEESDGDTARPPSPTGNAWSWIFKTPETSPREFLEDLKYFLAGRHTGFVLYLPMALVALGLFLRHNRRDPISWALLVSTAAIALFFLVFVSFNWHGGGGFIGNRYFVSLYPVFLFLVTAVRPLGLVAAGALWSALTVVPILLTPYGASMPEPTLQAHVRNAPFRWFPLELSLKNVPGYERLVYGDGGLRVVGRRDVFLPQGDSWWLRGGGEAVDLWLLAEPTQPLRSVRLRVESGPPDQTVTVDLESEEQVLDFAAAGEPRTIELRPRAPRARASQWGRPSLVYRLRLRAERARMRPFIRQFPPNACPYFPQPSGELEGFPVGAVVTYLGEAEALERDVYAAEWLEVAAPTTVRRGERFRLRVRLRNSSAFPWTRDAAARVRLAYHWLDEAGTVVTADGERTELPAAVAPGATVEVAQDIVAPIAPGAYILELDPVFETVAWFGARNPASTRRVAITVE